MEKTILMIAPIYCAALLCVDSQDVNADLNLLLGISS